jgi:hypothetical protein
MFFFAGGLALTVAAIWLFCAGKIEGYAEKSDEDITDKGITSDPPSMKIRLESSYYHQVLSL